MNLAELKKLWNGLDDVPIVDDEDGDTVIDSDYYIWEKGTDWNDILHWFDERCPHGFGKDLMGD